MAQLSKSAFLSKYAGIFADNTMRAISEGDMRDFRADIADSFLLYVESTPLIWGGLWGFPGGALPTAAKAGTLYIASADYGLLGDAVYVASGTWFASIVDGANTFSQYSFKP